MARTKISEFSATAADNTDIDNIDIAEGCAPSGINNAIRELMAQLKDFQTGAAGDPFNGAVNGTVGATTPAAGTFTNLAYTGTLTGGTGVINIGSGQIYKDASGNLGLGVTPSAWSSGFKALEISGGSFTSSSNANVLMFQNAYFNGTSYIYNTSAQASYYRQQAGEHRFYNAPSGTAGNTISFTQAMTLTDAGRLGIGTTSPPRNLSVYTQDTYAAVFNTGVTSAASTRISLGGFSNADGGAGGSAAIGAIHFHGGTAVSSLAFYTHNGTTLNEVGRFDGNGNLLVGTTSVGGDGLSIRPRQSGGGTTFLQFNRAASSTSGNVLLFENGGTSVGSVSHNNTTTTYSTSSDYRLKENVRPLAGALDRIMQLEPSEWDWKADGSQGVGFIAHKVQAIRPQAVTGTKDAVDKDGKPVYQGMDASFLVADLTAAFQELKTEFDAYKAAHP